MVENGTISMHNLSECSIFDITQYALHLARNTRKYRPARNMAYSKIPYMRLNFE